MIAALLVLVALLAAASTGLALRLRGRERAIREREQDLATISRVARALATADDARVAVCHAARWVTGATSAVLWEPQEDGALIATASAGTPLPHLRLAPGREPSLEVACAVSGRELFSADLQTDVRANPRLRTMADHPAAAHFEPIRHDDAVVGVLVVGWDDAQRAAPRLARRLMPLIATEAAESIERADLVIRLAELALTDTLTGLGNRRAWDDWIALALRDAAADAEPRLTVALIDIDHFKGFNDTRGHQDGDRLLKEAGAAWRSHLRPGDRLARYGGEEFAVLLPHCDEPCAAIVIERLRAAMPAGQTCSAGVAQWDGHEAPAQLVARADAALYAAKQTGRDRVVAAAQLPSR
jgi:diguanylate cyclase (GGDEF)-like protein